MMRGKNSGFTLVLSVAVIAILLYASVGLLSIAVMERQTAVKYHAGIQTLQIADSGVQKALFCLGADDGDGCDGSYGESYAGEAGIELGSGTFTTDITGSGDERELTSIGVIPGGYSTVLKVKLTRTPSAYTDTVFDYALMVTNGATISNNFTVENGPVYSAADIECGNNAEMEGDIFVSKTGGTIDNCDIGGEAHADRIIDSDIAGDCYYNDLWDKSDCGGTLYSGQPTPEARNLPMFDEPFWQAQAEAGGTISGDYEPTDGSVLGPKKIDGDLTLGNNVDVTLTGPVWITGSLYMTNNSTLTLDSSFGALSTVVMVGGLIDVVNNAAFHGSGTAGSYILLYTSSTSDPAIEIRNNAGTAVYLAPYGGVKIWNNAGAVAIAAKYASLEQDGAISYDELGLPSDLQLRIETDGTDWEITPGTWRKL